MKIFNTKIPATVMRSLTVLVLSLIVPSAYAYERAFIVANDSDQTIKFVHVSEDYSQEWGDDRLGADVVIPVGTEHTVRFNVEYDHCIFNIWIIAENEFERGYSNVDLCESPSPRVVFANEWTFTVENKSNQAIRLVQASMDYLTEWGDDRLDGEVIMPGNEFLFKVDSYRGHCLFDIRLTMEDESDQTYEGVDLCEIDRVIYPPAPLITFTVENKSDQAIWFVQASMDYLTELGDDRLDDELIMPGDEFLVQVDGDRGHCLFNIRLTMADDSEQDYESVDLCEIDRVIYPPAAPIKVEVVPRQVGEQFRDCVDWNCPWMVAIEAGSYERGSRQGNDDEIPVTRVTVRHNFAVGLYEVSVGQFRYFVQSTGHSAGARCEVNQRGRWAVHDGWSWENPGFAQTDSHPVVCVSWEDAVAYAQWLSQETQKPYRLLTEAEWEYLGRVTNTTLFKSSGRANCKGCGSRWDGKGTAPVGMFQADRWGLHELYGNAWEWVQDCYTPGYSSAPRDGSAWELAGCNRRVHRGGSWTTRPERLRAALRNSDNAAFRSSKIGFRVAQTIDPAGVLDSGRPVASTPPLTRGTESNPNDKPSIDSDYSLEYSASPAYPLVAEREGIEGYATVQFTITVEGKVRDPVVVDAVPPDVFNAAAIEAVRKFEYRPRIVNGQPVEVSGVPMRFRFEL